MSKYSQTWQDFSLLKVFFYLTEYVSVILFLKGVQYDMKKILIVFTVVAMLLMITACNPGIPRDDVPGVTGPDVEPGETHVNTLSADGQSFYAYDIDTSSYKSIECGMTIDVLKPNAGEDTGAMILLWTKEENDKVDSQKMIFINSTPSSVTISIGGQNLYPKYDKGGKASFDITAIVRNDNTMEIELSAESAPQPIGITTSIPEGSKSLYTGLVAVDGIPLSYLKLQETSCFRVN